MNIFVKDNPYRDYWEKSRKLNDRLIDPEGGDKADTKLTGDTNSNNESTESEEDPFEAIVLDVFQHLDDFNDGVIQHDEVMPILKYFKGAKGGDQSAKEEFESIFQGLQSHGMLDFDAFLKFIEQLQLREVIETIRDDLYN